MKNEFTPEFYSTIIQNSHDMITIIDPEGVYKYVSDSIHMHFGFVPEELIGENALGWVHPDDLSHVMETLGAIKTAKQLKAKPFRYRHADGSWRWLSTIVTNMESNPVINGFVTNSRDITEEIEAAAKSEKSNALYQALFYNHPDLVLTMDESGIILEINSGSTRVSGFEVSEAIGRHFTDFLAPIYLQETQQAFRKVIEGGAHTFETGIINKQNEQLDLSVTLVPVWFADRINAVHCIAKDITKVKQSEKLVRDQASQLNNILGSITEAFFALNRDWRITYANRTFARYFDASTEAVIGRNIWLQQPELNQTQFYNKCKQVMETGVAHEHEEFIPILQAVTNYKIYPFEDGIAVCFTDITAKKAAQEELSKLSLVASKTTNGVIITDKQGKIEWGNHSFEKLTGYAMEELLHQDPTVLLKGPETNKEVMINLRRLLGLAVPFSEELLTYKKNGEKIWIAADITPILNDEGDLQKFIVLYTDISDRKFAEEKLLQMNEDLVLQNNDLQQFTYIVSHNLRAPIANVMGLTRLLPVLEPGSENFKKAIVNLDKSALRLDSVITDLCEILSVKGPESSESHELLSLDVICTEVLQSVQDMLNIVNANFILHVQPGLEIKAKKAYLYSIIHNLITNAIKYRATDKPLQIVLRAYQTTDGIQIEVKDNGLGMDMDQVRPHIFKLYKRFHVHTEGKGLGLYLVKTQVEALNGTIEVDSAQGNGSTFRVFFRNQQYDKKGIYN